MAGAARGCADRAGGRTVVAVNGVDERYASAAADDMARLYGYQAQNIAKYQRNYSRYYNNGKYAPPSLFAVRSDSCPGFNIWAARNPGQGYQTSINALASGVDAIQSKISQARIRPFFQPVQGDYRTIKAARSAQRFFDGYFDAENIYQLAADVFRDAIIFDKGIAWIDEIEGRIKRIEPWQVCVDPAEFEYSGPAGLTRVSVQLKEFPFLALRRVYGDEVKALGIAQDSEAREFAIHWDFEKKRKAYFYGDTCFRIDDIEYTRPPFAWIYWIRPIKGYNSVSFVDQGYTIQVNIDELQLRIDEATRRSVFNTVFVPKNSGVKASMMTNEAGKVMEYTPDSTGGGIVVSTPPAISEQYVNLLKYYIQVIFENGGISQLSAQSKKPAGADSGRALETLANIESERFNVALQGYMRFFIDLTNVIIDVMPGTGDIIKSRFDVRGARWADVKKQRDAFTINFAAASALSKDPTRRLTEIDQLVQRGYIAKEMAASLMQLPDVEGAYSASTAAYDYAQFVIERAIEEGIIEYLPLTNLELLFSEAVQWTLRLSADEANEKLIGNLKRLLEKIQDDLSRVEMPGPTETPAGPVPVAAAGAPAGAIGG